MKFVQVFAMAFLVKCVFGFNVRPVSSRQRWGTTQTGSAALDYDAYNQCITTDNCEVPDEHLEKLSPRLAVGSEAAALAGGNAQRVAMDALEACELVDDYEGPAWSQCQELAETSQLLETAELLSSRGTVESDASY